jgi:hypothetical protein
MEDHLDPLERRLDDLTRVVAGLEQRLQRIEAAVNPSASGAAVAAGPSTADAVDVTSELPVPVVDGGSVAGVLAILGRSFLVLCGAFLLRSLTDAGFLPQPVGIGLGYLYAATWIVLADRAAAAGRALAATLSGAVASIIAFPLLWEATSRFDLLSTNQAVAGLALFSALALAVAWRHELRTLAVIVALSALTINLVLMLAHRNWAAASALAIAIAAYSVWAAYLRGWSGLRWPVAAVVDVLPLMLISNAVRGIEPGIPPGPSSATLVLVCSSFIAVYLGSFTLSMLWLRRRVGAFEVAQGVVVLLAGFGALHHCLSKLGIDDRWFGVLTLLAGLVCYGAAFAFIDRRFGRGGNFIYLSSLALILTTGGLAIATHGTLGVAVLCGLAVAAAALGARFDRITLRSHCAAYLAAAAALGTAIPRFMAAFTLSPDRVPHPPSAADLLVVGTAIVCTVAFALARGRAGRRWPMYVPDLLVGATALVGFGAVLLMTFCDLAAPASAPSLAAARTALLAAAAVVAAWLGSVGVLPALRWLVYPLLVLGGLKLVVEDLRLGRPAMLLVAFACFGLALILAPRLLRTSALPRDTPSET